MMTWERTSLRNAKERMRKAQAQIMNELNITNTKGESEGFVWYQYRPVKIMDDQRRKSSIKRGRVHSVAKRLMAREWARILGRIKDTKFYSLEREAAFWNQRIEMRKR